MVLERRSLAGGTLNKQEQLKAKEQSVIYTTEPSAWTVRKTDGSAIWRWLHEKQSAQGCCNSSAAIVSAWL